MGLLQRTLRRLAMSPYGVYLQRTASQFPISSFKGSIRQKIIARGRAVARAYSQLSKAEHAKLVAAARKAKTPRRRVPAKRLPNVYSRFVRANYHKVKRLSPSKRLAALAKLWRAKH